MHSIPTQKYALQLLQTALDDKKAAFRDGQWQSIEFLLNRRRILVVQRTGWGKSMVYFLGTKLLREQGKGLTLLISPLLSLMRNQLEAANRLGLSACTINSSNVEEWDKVESDLKNDRVDILLISPERLANQVFRENILSHVASKIGMLVVDEAHCISDWGHDFRPDYRRIIRVIQAIPPNVPILATTATANDRVVNDVKTQLGGDIGFVRGTLVRKSLKLQNIIMPDTAARMAWLAGTIPRLPGSGIVYTLTQRDSVRVAQWLKQNGISAQAYHAGMSEKEPGGRSRQQLEQSLLNNEIKVLVATVALGMGFDKPDLGFVIHYQRPASVVHYYQQVGRAGRAVDQAYGILLCGEEDDRISDYFIQTAFPPQRHIETVLQAVTKANTGISTPSLMAELNLKYSQIEKTLKFLTIESPAPVIKMDSKWYLTPAASDYSVNRSHVEMITRLRRDEQEQMRSYMRHDGCLMAFLQSALDDPRPQKCGMCKNCTPQQLLEEKYDLKLAQEANLFLKRCYIPIKPRLQWPAGNPLKVYGFTGSISDQQRLSEGRALSLWRDAGWGQLAADGKYQSERFCDDLVSACAQMYEKWAPEPKPKWATCIPSLNRPELVPDFARRLSEKLGLRFGMCFEKVRQNMPQKEMENSYQQAANLDGVFKLTIDNGTFAPCLLIDDVVDSRWTFTVAAALLRQAGCKAVYPLALAMNSPRMD
ncbi:ATP-dependent DNA helicase RecQ [Limihaloglobus sulfuriphilus]|uniref:DNA 3'-5' helicase n=1 Tax=Limihaloglobus sulfuriphilus TaxID=1851148 RepID=A0A1Q2MHX7_9BACT|nr:RecQ family ATP-dependent DNA helicase [Limihaloglobus sulfuriphilus]AQQ72290.1 ATP-dependent DNA helicase RecQ [Limihaloglobus sulfuriphilus]